MPIPKTKNVGKIMDFLKKEDGHKWPAKGQKIAIALSTARKAGANIPFQKEIKKRAKK